MRITTLVALPEEVYNRFRDRAAMLGTCTVEQLLTDALVRAAEELPPQPSVSVSRSR